MLNRKQREELTTLFLAMVIQVPVTGIILRLLILSYDTVKTRGHSTIIDVLAFYGIFVFTLMYISAGFTIVYFCTLLRDKFKVPEGLITTLYIIQLIAFFTASFSVMQLCGIFR